MCVARRIPPNEESTGLAPELFITKLDTTGKIISIDTSGVSSTYSQYLNRVKYVILTVILSFKCCGRDERYVAENMPENFSVLWSFSGKHCISSFRYCFIPEMPRELNCYRNFCSVCIVEIVFIIWDAVRCVWGDVVTSCGLMCPLYVNLSFYAIFVHVHKVNRYRNYCMSMCPCVSSQGVIQSWYKFLQEFFRASVLVRLTL